MSHPIDFEGDLDFAQLELNSPAQTAAIAPEIVRVSTAAPTGTIGASTAPNTTAPVSLPPLTLEEFAERRRTYQKYSSLRARTSELLVAGLESKDQSLQRNAATFNLLGKLLTIRPRNSPYKKYKKTNNKVIENNNDNKNNINTDNNEIRSYRK